MGRAGAGVRTGAVSATGSPSTQKPAAERERAGAAAPVLEHDDVLAARLLDPHDGADPAGGDLLDDEAGLGGLRAAGAGGSVVRRGGAPEHVRAVAVVVHPGSLGARASGAVEARSGRPVGVGVRGVALALACAGVLPGWDDGDATTKEAT